MKLIPFDLKLAQEGHPIQTRDGRPAKFIAHVPGLGYPVVALVGQSSTVSQFATTGAIYSAPVEDGRDLFMTPVTHTRWLNFYPSVKYSYAYSTKELADEHAGPDRIACIQITYTEGEGL
jgi:hypothetical protein